MTVARDGIFEIFAVKACGLAEAVADGEEVGVAEPGVVAAGDVAAGAAGGRAVSDDPPPQAERARAAPPRTAARVRRSITEGLHAVAGASSRIGGRTSLRLRPGQSIREDRS
ncbi:hypothetical protein GCM10023195_82500 [Actinoallomurus liliacearum]|uniref:Uncharacterized protein n=1 Tax=Actinoallomurus liliacearum TaxID=1080073 RepID=A0ABP8U0S3_9ACTN